MGPAGRATFDAITDHTGAEALDSSPEVSPVLDVSPEVRVSAVLAVKFAAKRALAAPHA